MARLMDALISVLQRLTCRLWGHDWQFKNHLGENARGYAWLEFECTRCRDRQQRKV